MGGNQGDSQRTFTGLQTVGLHFMKDIMTKRLVFPIPEAKEVLEFAKEMNPEIHIGNVNE